MHHEALRLLLVSWTVVIHRIIRRFSLDLRFELFTIAVDGSIVALQCLDGHVDGIVLSSR